MISLLLYILICMVFVELSMRSFFETNFAKDESFQKKFSLFLLFRSLATFVYLGAFMLVGSNLFLGLCFSIGLCILDMFGNYLNQRVALPINTILGLFWLASLIAIAFVGVEYIRVNSFQITYIIEPLKNAVHQIFHDLKTEEALVYLVGYLFSIHGANRIVGWVLTDLKFNNKSGGNNIEDEISLKRAGRFIGSLERMFVITFMLLGQYAFAIGFIFTAKTFARFDLVRKQAEYYLVGTLTSLLVALGISACIKLISG